MSGWEPDAQWCRACGEVLARRQVVGASPSRRAARRAPRSLLALAAVALVALSLAATGELVRNVLRPTAGSGVALPAPREIPQRQAMPDRPWLTFEERYAPHVTCAHTPGTCVAWSYAYESRSGERDDPVVIPESDLVVIRDGEHLRALDLQDGGLRWEVTPWDSRPIRGPAWSLTSYPELDVVLVTTEVERLGISLGSGTPLWHRHEPDEWVDQVWPSGASLRMLDADGRLTTLDPRTGEAIAHQPVRAAVGDGVGEAVLTDDLLVYREHGAPTVRWEVQLPARGPGFRDGADEASGADGPDDVWLWLDRNEVGVGTDEGSPVSFSRRDGRELALAPRAPGRLRSAEPQTWLEDRLAIGGGIVEVWMSDEGWGELRAPDDREARRFATLGRSHVCCLLDNDVLVLWRATHGRVLVDTVEGASSVNVAEVATGRDGRLFSPGGEHRTVIVHGKRRTAGVHLPDGTIAWETDRELHPVGEAGELLAWRGGFLRLIPPPEEPA